MLAIRLENNLRKRIFLSITGVTLVALLIFTFLNSYVTYRRIFETEKVHLKREFIQIKSKLLSQDSEYDFSVIFTPSRMTVINTAGVVLFDNAKDFQAMENHADRSEVVALLNQTSAESTRMSDTLGKQTYYYAEKIDTNTILRLSITIESVYGIIKRVIPLMLFLVIVIVIVAIALSGFLSKKIVAPLYNIDEPIYDELDLFYQKIRGQKRQIKKQSNRLKIIKEEIKILTKNIANGFILLDDKNKIISINKTATKIFGSKKSSFLNKDVFELNRSEEFICTIERAYAGNSSELTLKVSDRECFLHVSPVKNNKKGIQNVSGLLIIVIDMTEKAQAEKLRREFSANVSHELKTPLTSILGYAEIIKEGLAKPEDIKGFNEKIYTEATNLLELIEDILKISQLDEMKQTYKTEPVNLALLIENIISRLEIIAEKKNVIVKTDLEDVCFEGIQSVLDETFYNIIENAIKYNVVNGVVLVTLTKTSSKIKISVKDSGIGIPKESHDRVFERFYRVDKSHSSNIKGSGLGLSIVKHAVNVHKGKILLESEVMKGTKITVIFPK